VVLNGRSQLSIAGGSVRSTSGSGGTSRGVIANDDSNVDFSTGSLSFVRFEANDNSNINFSGGSNSFANFNSNGNSTFTVSGGDFSQANFTANDFSNFIISGGSTQIRNLTANDEGTIVIRGSHFNLGFGEVTGTSGAITGDLQDGTSFDYNYQRGSLASIILAVAVPEPSSLAVLTLACIGLVVPRNRRRSQR